MARSTALARKDAEITRLRAGQSAALYRARQSSAATIAAMRGRVAAVKKRAESKTAVGLAAVGAGAVVGGQVARMHIMPDAQGASRAPLLNYVAGAVGFLALASGRARSTQAMGAAAAGVGMGIAQIAIKSYTEWDLVPFNIGGA